MQFNKKIILGSKSPRRSEILQLAEIPFELRIKEVDECYPGSVPLRQVPEYIALKKAEALKDTIQEDEIVLCADTIVLLEGKIYGKPFDKEDAIHMLKALSGNTHEVITGVCLMNHKDHILFSDTTKVTFKSLSEDEIKFYIDRYQPYDKAGSYAVQEWIGVIGIESIRGNFYNIVGLPLSKVLMHLQPYAI